MKSTKKAAAPVLTPDATPEEKKKALSTAITQIERAYGKGSIIKMGENPRMSVSAVSSGSLNLDMVFIRQWAEAESYRHYSS